MLFQYFSASINDLSSYYDFEKFTTFIYKSCLISPGTQFLVGKEDKCMRLEHSAQNTCHHLCTLHHHKAFCKLVLDCRVVSCILHFLGNNIHHKGTSLLNTDLDKLHWIRRRTWSKFCSNNILVLWDRKNWRKDCQYLCISLYTQLEKRVHSGCCYLHIY